MPSTSHLISLNEAAADAHEAAKDAAHAEADARVDEMNREFEAMGMFDDVEPYNHMDIMDCCEAHNDCPCPDCQACACGGDDLPF